MSLHTASGRWQLGLGLAISTAFLWATLPVALKLVLRELDALTLTWFRFAFAAVGLGIWLGWRGRLGQLRGLGGRDRVLLGVAAIMLIGNYVLYLMGLDHTTPANAQLIIQLAPLLMALGGILIFRERFLPAQWLGLVAVAIGLLGFFNDQRSAHAGQGNYLLGATLIVLAAVVWAIYSLAQKQLLMRLSSPVVLWVIYLAAAVLLLPTADLPRLSALGGWAWVALIYCALNTLAAYGAFAEALAHWEASRVSAILALTPLLTWLCVETAHALWPGLVAAERIGLWGWIGALCVVAGAASVSLFGQRRR